MERNEPKRYLSIRLLPAEFKEIHQQYKSSGCGSLTEYAKKVLMNKPVTNPITEGGRNESIDEILHCLIGIKSRLDSLEEHLDERTDAQLRQEMADIKSFTREFYEKWSHFDPVFFGYLRKAKRL